METKSELRKLYKAKRRKLAAGERENLSANIVQHVLDYLTDKEHIRHIHIFLPINILFEINTYPLIDKLLLENRVINTSISNHAKNEMETVKLTANPNYLEDDYGIPVPSEWLKGNDSTIQLVLIPLLAYDLKGHRLGYGKGFYDKFLSKLPREAVKAGLSYFPPETQIPVEPHDVPLDLCFLPGGILKFNKL